MGVCGGLGAGLAKNTGRNFTHFSSHQMAVALKIGIVQVAGLLEVHLTAFDYCQQVTGFDVVVGRVGEQGLHDGVRWLPGKGFNYFTLPPGQFGRRHPSVDHVVHHIVHLTAKGVKRSDGSTSGRRQEQKGIVKTAAGGCGLLLDVLLGGHGAIVTQGADILAALARSCWATVLLHVSAVFGCRISRAAVLLRVPRPLGSSFTFAKQPPNRSAIVLAGVKRPTP